MRTKELVLVRFIMKNAPYNVGETAGFPEAIAKRLIDRKRAVIYVPPGQEEPPKDVPVEETVIEPPAASEPKPKPKAKARKKK